MVIPQSVSFTGRNDEIPLTPHWFLGWMLVHLWISQAVLILVRVNVLITSTPFVNSHPLHKNLPSKFYSVRSEYLSMHALLSITLKMLSRDANWKGIVCLKVKLTVLNKHISAWLSCMKSFITVCDGMLSFCMFYWPSRPSGYFKVHDIDLFTFYALFVFWEAIQELCKE